jgi:hypothetical protein
LAWGKPRIFPECSTEGCRELADLKKVPPYDFIYSSLETARTNLQIVNIRLANNTPAGRIYTEQERQAYLKLRAGYEKEIARLQRDLGITEKITNSLFGIAQ